MIISIRGTNGAGKSTIVREVMRLAKERVADYRVGRRKPVGYLLDDRVYVVGHYEIANGGVDTLRSLDEAYALALEYALEGRHVLMEGKNMSDGPRRLLALRDDAEVRVITLSPPLARCVASVRRRGHDIAEKTIRRLHGKVRADHDKFEEAGVLCLLTWSRRRALAEVRSWLEI